MLLLLLVGCAPKRLVIDTLAEADVYASSRPVPAEYDAWALVKLQECEAADHDVHVEDAIRTATTGHDALVEVVVQRRVREEYLYWTGWFGRPVAAPVLASRTVCYDVSGVPVDFRDEGSESLAVAAPAAPRAPVIPTAPLAPVLVRSDLDALRGWGDVRWGGEAVEGPAPDGTLWGLRASRVRLVTEAGRLVAVTMRLEPKPGMPPVVRDALTAKLGPPGEGDRWLGEQVEIAIVGDEVTIRPKR